MTREQQIDFIREQIDIFPQDSKMGEFLRDMLKALEQEPILDKIRSEINKLVIRDKYSQRQNDYCDGVEFMCNLIKEIIDKYKAESEG